MSFLDSLTGQASKLATDVQQSLRRARVEGERRVLQRQHRAALEELGERAYELVRAGKLPADDLGPQIAAVEARLMEIEAKVTEIDALRSEAGDDGARAEEATAPGDAADVAFPMLKDAPPTGAADEGRPGGPGPGWEAADRFFKH
mgnify:FL=1